MATKAPSSPATITPSATSPSPPPVSPTTKMSPPAPKSSSTKPSPPVSVSPTTKSPSPAALPNPPALPPINTNTGSVRRTTTAPRPPSYASKRMSSYQKNNLPSRPTSHVFPIFHSSLPYTLVRDFAYPINHPYHYGPPPQTSGLSTPASETRRLSDPPVPSWDDARGSRAAIPPWTTENPGVSHSSHSREQLPAMTFSDGGPPYSEDEDLHSPVVTTSRHKKSKSAMADRGRSPGVSADSGNNNNRGVLVGVNGDGSETYYVTEGTQAEDTDGPGGEIVTYPPDPTRPSLLSPEHHHVRSSRPHRDSHFATSLRRRPQEDDNNQYPNLPPTSTSPSSSADEEEQQEEEGEDEDEDEDDDATRFSRNYSFTIASPDEEMHGKAVALFDFESEHENELPLAEGQIILVSYRHGQGWLVAQDPKTGESGLVPEEFVRLVRDIEGGLNGLSAQMQMDEVMSPGSDHAPTPTAARGGGVAGGGGERERGAWQHEQKPSNAGAGNHVAAVVGSAGPEKHPPVQSTFSTSSKDLERYPLQQRDKGDEHATPTLPSHPLRNELA